VHALCVTASRKSHAVYVTNIGEVGCQDSIPRDAPEDRWALWNHSRLGALHCRLWGSDHRVLPMFAYASASQAPKNPNYPSLVGKRILVVDDEPVISVDYWFQLLEIGATPEAFLPTNAAALHFLAAHSVDAVILDYRLRDGTSEPLMRWLHDQQIPFVIISEWVEKLQREATDAPILAKPALADDLWKALSGVVH
jgi:CheY-like chemotaxis protein